MDLQTLIDYLILAAGVRLYSLFNDNPAYGDEYFLEHMDIVVEVKEVNHYTFLLQRRTDISSLLGDGFDFDIINPEMANQNSHAEEAEGNEVMAETEIHFNRRDENRFPAIEAPIEEEEEEEEGGGEEEEEEAEDVERVIKSEKVENFF
ncbi:uncharacterized protein LOC122510920 [Leptopilina heterotoma]|uniref:uncharacterized protein LOC122510920 n=1 Tax=Leptopilina heterotoma TaxID=63436 RepID=UPI001CA8F71A|nr:uncharacterized protein LOC122510920 [Leptopilina heterotoma]